MSFCLRQPAEQLRLLLSSWEKQVIHDSISEQLRIYHVMIHFDHRVLAPTLGNAKQSLPRNQRPSGEQAQAAKDGSLCQPCFKALCLCLRRGG